MSNITLYNENVKTITSTITDSNRNEKPIETVSATYSENKDQYALLHIDLLGNTYLKHNSTYYIVSIDEYTASGVELTKIKNPNIFRRRLIDELHLRSRIRSGKINSNNTTLRGKAYESISSMTDEEKSDYMEKNDYLANDDGCEEKKYFWVKYNNDDSDDEFENETEEGFYLNGFANDDDDQSGIVHSDLLSPVLGSFEVILIKGDIGSKCVVSNISKIDGFCTSTLTVFTSGKLKTNFTCSTKLARLCLDSNNEIMIKPVRSSD